MSELKQNIASGWTQKLEKKESVIDSDPEPEEAKKSKKKKKNKKKKKEEDDEIVKEDKEFE